LKEENLKHYIVVASALILSVAVISVVFLSCKAGGTSVGNAALPNFVQAPGSPISITGGPGNVVIGDMNKDSKLDLVVATGQSRSIAVLLGRGDGQFQAPRYIQLTGSESPGEIALGDLNGDSALDLAFVTHDSYGVTMLLGDGQGGLALAPNSPIVMKAGQHPHTHGLGIGDMNGDGKLDLTTVNNADNDVSVALGDGRGNFTNATGSPFAVGPSPYPHTLGDVNNDGRLDIVATTTATGPARAQQLPFSRALTLLLNDGRGGFRSSQLPLRTGQPWFVAIGDFNGDRKPDLAATHHEQSALSVMLGDGRGGFSEPGDSPFNYGHNVFQTVVADVNRDAKLDVIAAAGDGFRVMLGDGRGNFQLSTNSPFATGRGIWRLAVADLNGDGRPDVVTSNSESDAVSVLLGQ
jgi:VCBS repeat protein